MENDGPGPADPSSPPLQPDLPALKPSTAAAESPSRVTVNGSDPPPDGQGAGAPLPTCGPRKGAELSTTKLCGYLDKQGGPLKSWKSRWFCYDEKRCQLLYYTTAQDVTPLGKIELINAVFGYSAQADEGAFHIQTPERTVVLKAFNRDTMIYWLQQLRLRRWHHGHAAECMQSACGNGDDDDLLIVKTPPRLVGQEAARLPAPRQQSNLSVVSFKHPLTQIQNSMYCILQKRHSPEMNRSIFYSPSNSGFPVQENQDLSGQEEPPRDRPSNSSPSSSPTPSSPSKKKSISNTLPGDDDACSQEVDSDKDEHPKTTPEDGQCMEVSAQSGKQEQTDGPCPLKCDGPELDSQLRGMREELAVLQLRLAQRDAHVAELQEHLTLMMEKNQAKQEVVLKLSEQVANCMADPRCTTISSFGAQNLRQLQGEVEHLRDDIEAYKIQNKFLNSEIDQLTKLWWNSSEQQKILMKKCAYLEEKSCQTESSYLNLLHKLQENKGSGNEQREMVSRLVKEELQKDMKGTFKFNPVREHDEYGFKLTPDLGMEDVKLLVKIQSQDIHSLNPLQQEAMDKLRLSRWAQFLGGRPSGDLVASPELKTLLRGGVPSKYRANVWRWIVWTRTRQIRERYPQRYQELCRKSQTLQHPASRQIQLDLPRTLTSNQHISTPSNPCVQELHRILLAFSWYNPSIGYCQGLNRLAAIALLVLKDEENAFWCLVAMVEIMPRDYYSKTLIASQADQRVLKDIMMEKLPRLMAHLEEHSVDVTCITFNWFLVVFVESLTSRILLRVWDAFLYEGTKVLFRYALAIFRYKEEEILRIRSSAEIYQYLQFFTKTISDGRKLNNIAFVEMNPFPMKLLRSRRAHHLERLKAELWELERIQKEFLTETTEHKDRDLDPAVGEDEEDL